MPDWACKTCGVINLEGQRACESCGRERSPSAPTIPALTGEKTHAWEPCAWVTSDRPCPMIATIWLQPTGNYEFNQYGQVTKVTRPGYCGWHFETLTMPRLAQDFDEFERWHAYKRRRYCTQFSHHDAAYIWPVLHGTYRDPAERLVIQPCRASDCWAWDTLENEKWANPWTPQNAAGSVRELAAQLVRRFSVPVTPGRRGGAA